MALSIAHKKHESQLLEFISQIIYEKIENTQLSNVTVTSVVLSKDRSHLKVYFSFTAYPNQSLNILNKAKGFIRHQLALSAHLRKVPELHFFIDQTWEKSHKIEEILTKIKNK